MTNRGGWWCCCPGCPRVLDDFNRADSTDLGSLWDEIAGDPDDQAIYSNTLRQLHIGNRAELLAVPYPSWIASIAIKDSHHGDLANVIIDWIHDGSSPDTYNYVQFEVDTTANKCYLRLRSCLGGVHSPIVLVDANGHTTIAEMSISAAHIGANYDTWLHICLSSPDGENYTWAATLSTSEVTPGLPHLWQCLTYLPIEGPNPRRIVLENGGDGSLRWDSVQMDGHHAYRVDCPDCACTCEQYCIPRTLAATIINIEGAPGLDGVTTPFRNRNLATADQWVPDYYPSDSPPINERLQCSEAEYGVIQWLNCSAVSPYFELFSNWIACCAASAADATWVSTVCHPLAITFEYDFSSPPETGACRGFSVAPESPYSYVRRHFQVVVTV